MINVLHIGLDSEYGGIESYLYNLLRNIDREQVSFTFIGYRGHSAYEREIERYGSAVIPLSSRKNPIIYWLDIAKAIRLHSIDMVHIHKNSMADFLPVLCAKVLGVKRIVVHAHNGEHPIGFINGILHRFGRWLSRAVGVEKLACSEVAGEWVFGTASVFRMARNGVDVARFAYDRTKRDAFRHRFGIADDCLLLGCVGRLARQKNQTFAIRVLESALREKANVILAIVGEGPDKATLRELVADLGVADHVIFTGRLSEVDEAMCAFDFLLMPSVYEGLPIVAIEAQAAGLSVIASENVTEEVAMSPEFHRLGIGLSDAEDWTALIMKDGFADRRAPSEAVRGCDWARIGREMTEYYVRGKIEDRSSDRRGL